MGGKELRLLYYPLPLVEKVGLRDEAETDWERESLKLAASCLFSLSGNFQYLTDPYPPSLSNLYTI